MSHSHVKCVFLFVVTTALAAVAAPAWAQPAPGVEIDFSAASSAVPLSPWLVALIVVALAASGMVLLRRTHASRFGRLGAWLFAVICTAALVTVLNPPALISEALAAPPEVPITLTSSPATIGIPAGASTVVATNGLSVPITITHVGLVNPLSGQNIGLAFQSCWPPMVLAPGAVCYVYVSAI